MLRHVLSITATDDPRIHAVDAQRKVLDEAVPRRPLAGVEGVLGGRFWLAVYPTVICVVVMRRIVVRHYVDVFVLLIRRRRQMDALAGVERVESGVLVVIWCQQRCDIELPLPRRVRVERRHRWTPVRFRSESKGESRRWKSQTRRRRESQRRWTRRVSSILIDGQAHVFPHLSLSLSPTEISFLEVLDVGWVDGPVVAFAIGRSARLDEAIVEREIMANRVAPARTSTPKVRIIVEDVLVDVGEHELLVGHAENGHGYEADVAVLGLWLFGLEHSIVEQGHG